LTYPDLEMEKILEVEDVEVGTYAIESQGIKKINLTKNLTKKSKCYNIIEL